MFLHSIQSTQKGEQLEQRAMGWPQREQWSGLGKATFSLHRTHLLSSVTGYPWDQVGINGVDNDMRVAISASLNSR